MPMSQMLEEGLALVADCPCTVLRCWGPHNGAVQILNGRVAFTLWLGARVPCLKVPIARPSRKGLLEVGLGSDCSLLGRQL